MLTLNCTLCGAETHLFARVQGRTYFACPHCKAVVMNPEEYLSTKEECRRYQQHENNVEDTGYQQFVRPLVTAVKGNYRAGSSGLDYGSGSGPVAAKLLRDKGFIITTYDPFFDKNEAALHQSYDFIICSEVAEHFHNPDREFQFLYTLLNPGGHLYCMTLRYHPDIDFTNWYYKNDETHVIFYRKETARWIRKNYGFSKLRFEERLIILQK